MGKNLAVIVLNYNDAEGSIDYVNKIKLYKVIDKIIVVDNCSPDNSYEKLLHIAGDKVDVIKTEGNKGYAYGNNFAIRYLNEKYGEYKYIAISNSDVEVSEYAYKKCLEFLEKNKDVAIAAPRMYDINDNPHQLSGWKLRTLKGDIMDTSLLLTRLFAMPHIERYDPEYLSKDVAYVDCVAGSFFIIRHSMFKEVGYFDENTFLYFEEDILGNKLHKAGYKNVILNTCKFRHFESVTVDKSINFIRKFKILQKSKRYYHKNYNDKSNFLKLLILDFFTKFRILEERVKNYNIRINVISLNAFFIKLFKLFILIIGIVMLPINILMKKIRKKEKILYFSLVTWKWIKQRPHFISLGLSNTGDYKVDYIYQTLYKRYMPDETHKYVNNNINYSKDFKVKAFKIFPAVGFKTKLNAIFSVLKTSFWNYDKIIITHPNQIDFFFVRLLKLKNTEIYYECMDNYEGWEKNKTEYLIKEGRLISCCKKIIVSSEKLKEKLINIHNINPSVCVVVRNGYDKNLFNNYKNVKTNLISPNLVYIGTVDDWFDFDSILNFSKNNPEFHIDIIGPIGHSVEKKCKRIKNKNIKFHGPIEHDLVPKYIEDSDILIIPFIVNEIIEYVDPVKMYEYLYMKKPVVTSYWSELDQFKDFVYFYKGSKDFELKVKEAQKFKFKKSKEYEKLVKESTWDNRLKSYLEVLK